MCASIVEQCNRIFWTAVSGAPDGLFVLRRDSVHEHHRLPHFVCVEDLWARDSTQTMSLAALRIDTYSHRRDPKLVPDSTGRPVESLNIDVALESVNSS